MSVYFLQTLNRVLRKLQLNYEVLYQTDDNSRIHEAVSLLEADWRFLNTVSLEISIILGKGEIQLCAYDLSHGCLFISNLYAMQYKNLY